MRWTRGEAHSRCDSAVVGLLVSWVTMLCLWFLDGGGIVVVVVVVVVVVATAAAAAAANVVVEDRRSV